MCSGERLEQGIVVQPVTMLLQKIVKLARLIRCRNPFSLVDQRRVERAVGARPVG
jgi:hypothetical protein